MGLVLVGLAEAEGGLLRVLLLISSVLFVQCGEMKGVFVTNHAGHFRTEPIPETQRLPEKLKAEQAIVSRMDELTQGHLFDDVVSACADPDAQRLMMSLYCREGYAVGACFGGTHERVDAADVDLHHYRLAKTIGTSGCSTRTLGTIIRLLAEGQLNLDGFIDPDYFSLQDDPGAFFDWNAAGLRPAFDPWKKGKHGWDRAGIS